MLEIYPHAFCTDGRPVPGGWYGTVAPNSRRSCVNRGGRHSWLCSVQHAAPAVRDRVTPPGPASLRAARSRNSRRRIVTIVESYSCRMRKINPLKSYSCGKIGGRPLPAQLCCLRYPFRFKACGMSRCAKFARNSSRICTYGFIELKPALESTLTPENRCVRSLGIASPKALPEDRCSEQTR
jgi:hypothetical protein